MLPYYDNQQNAYTIRTEATSSGTAFFTMSLQNMTTQENSFMQFSGGYPYITYEPYESFVSFTGSIPSASVGEEYRATLIGGSEPIWHGTFQVYASQSVDKDVYENKNTQYVSHDSDNEYIIM